MYIVEDRDEGYRRDRRAPVVLTRVWAERTPRQLAQGLAGLLNVKSPKPCRFGPKSLDWAMVSGLGLTAGRNPDIVTQLRLSPILICLPRRGPRREPSPLWSRRDEPRSKEVVRTQVRS